MTARAASLAALALLAGAALAQSQDLCTGAQLAAPPNLVDFDPSKPTAPCADPVYAAPDFNEHGIAAWRYCRLPSGKYEFRAFVVPWDDFKAQPLLAVALMSAGVRADEAAIDAVLAQYRSMVRPLADPKNAPILCAALPKIRAGAPSDAPPPLSFYIVAPGAITRPTFAVANGKRVPGAVGSVPVLTNGQPTPCLGSPVISEWPLTYVGVTPTTVAVCVRR